MKTTQILAIFFVFVATAANAQKKIQLTELPTESVAFLEKHFPNMEITEVKKDREDGEKGYEVILANGTEIEFWKNGSWREVDGDNNSIPTAFIAKPILEYIRANYPNEKITHIDYGHKDVDVDLTNKINLEFTKDGEFIKED